MKKIGVAQSAYSFCNQAILDCYQVIPFDENAEARSQLAVDAWVIPVLHMNDWKHAVSFSERAPVLLLVPSDKKELLKGPKNANIDYLLFPFETDDFDLRIEKLLMMNEPSLSLVPSIDALTMTVNRKNLKTEALTVKEFQILKWLKFRDHRGLSRAEILHRVWDGKKMSKKVVDVHLHNLRKKLLAIEMDIVFDDVNRRYLLKPGT